VLLVAIVAVARKVIILEYKDLSPETLLAMSAMIIALSAGFFVVKRALSRESNAKDSTEAASRQLNHTVIPPAAPSTTE